MFTFDQRGLITMTAVGFCLLRIMPIYPCFQGLISSKILICEENVTGKKKVSFFLEPWAKLYYSTDSNIVTGWGSYLISFY